MARRIVFRADASADIGLGHLRRCLTLASAFDRLGWTVGLAISAESAALLPPVPPYQICILRGGAAAEHAAMRNTWPSGTDILFVDHYERDAAFEAAGRGWARRISALDDLPTRQHEVDLLIDYTPGRLPREYDGLVPADAVLLTGAEYVPVRPEIIASGCEHRQIPPRARHTVITFGGADPGSLVERTLAAIADERLLDMKADIVMGPAARRRVPDQPVLGGRVQFHVNPDNFPMLLAQADMAIAGSGTTCWELAYLGVPALLIVNSPGDTVTAMVEAGAGLKIGNESDVTPPRIAEMWSVVAADIAGRAAMGSAGRRLIDGQGAHRIARAMEDLLP